MLYFSNTILLRDVRKSSLMIIATINKRGSNNRKHIHEGIIENRSPTSLLTEVMCSNKCEGNHTSHKGVGNPRNTINLLKYYYAKELHPSVRKCLSPPEVFQASKQVGNRLHLDQKNPMKKIPIKNQKQQARIIWPQKKSEKINKFLWKGRRIEWCICRSFAQMDDDISTSCHLSKKDSRLTCSTVRTNRSDTKFSCKETRVYMISGGGQQRNRFGTYNSFSTFVITFIQDYKNTLNLMLSN